MVNTPTLKLNNGLEMPQVGLGVWKIPNDVCADIVYQAIKTGYRLIDGAFDYGNEKECGQGIKRAIDDGLVKREDLFIVSKLWNTFHEKDRVEPICRKQLEWWGIDYFDLYLMHFPLALEYVDPEISYPSGWKTPEGKVAESKATIQETWQAMELVVDAGLARSIGVANFCGALLIDLMRYARIRPAVLQIEHHPYLVQSELLDCARQLGIAVTAYSSFGPQSFIEMEYTNAQNTPSLFENPTIVEIAKRCGKTPAQVLLRWATQRGVAVIPKSISPHRLEENLDVAGFDIDESDLTRISALDKGLRFNNPRYFLGTLYIFA